MLGKSYFHPFSWEGTAVCQSTIKELFVTYFYIYVLVILQAYHGELYSQPYIVQHVSLFLKEFVSVILKKKCNSFDDKKINK